jgi:putative ABC transport system permease protein
MSLFKIAWRSIEQRRLASFLTGLSMALGVTLVIAVLVIHSVVHTYFSGSTGGAQLARR